MWYDGPRQRTGVFDGKDWDGSGYDWPWRGSLLHSGASWGTFTIVIFIVVFVGIFVRPQWQLQLNEMHDTCVMAELGVCRCRVCGTGCGRHVGDGN